MALTSHRRQRRKIVRHPLNPTPLPSSPQRRKPEHLLTHHLSNSSCWCLPEPRPPLPLHLCLHTADLILAPTCPGRPLAARFLQPGSQAKGAGQRRGWSAEGRRPGDAETGRHRWSRAGGQTQVRAPLAAIPPAPAQDWGILGTSRGWGGSGLLLSTHLPSLAQMSEHPSPEGKAALMPL